MSTPSTTRRPQQASRWTATAGAAVLALALTACGDGGSDDGPEAGDPAGSPGAETTGASVPADESTTAAGPLTVANLASRCDELAAVVTTLRGDPPEETEPSAETTGHYNGFDVRTAHCDYAYAGDEFSDPNRVSIYLESQPDDLAGLRAYWDEIASSEPVPGVGDEASYHFNDAFDAKASARALVGPSIVSVRVAAPKDQAGAAYLRKDAVVAAREQVVAAMQ